MIIDHLRTYEADRTTGTIEVEGNILAQTIEDIGRPKGIKIPKETCIPEGSYHVTITESARFRRPMILLYTSQIRMTCDHDGISFAGIRVHGGTKTNHTEGCILIPDPVSLSFLENFIGRALRGGEPVTWNIGRA
jgi:hypothetical protein